MVNACSTRLMKDNETNYLPQCHCGYILGCLPSSLPLTAPQLARVDNQLKLWQNLFSVLSGAMEPVCTLYLGTTLSSKPWLRIARHE